MPPKAKPLPSQYLPLLYLRDQADDISDDFFTIDYTNSQTLSWKYKGVKLSVHKRTYSEAEPKNITYEVFLGTFMPDGSEQFLVSVLEPKGPALNRAAYKRCLQELAEKESFEMSQKTA